LKLIDKEAILFDLDGTPIDSVPELSLAVNSMLKSLNRGTSSEDLVGNGAEKLVQRAILGDIDTTQGVDKKFYDKALSIFLTFYEDNLSGTTIYPNIIETLSRLKDMGYRIAIVTNKPFNFVEPILDGPKIGNLFEYVIGEDSLSRRKPDPMSPLLS